MINKIQAQMFCSEPIELIENYEEAVNDKTQVWHCHHIWGTMLGYSKDELIEMNEYYGIPACNLIFLTHSEHSRIHSIGEKNNFFGKHHSEETKKKIRERFLGKYNNKTSIPILQFTKDGEFVAEYPSMTECERQTGINHRMISRVASGKRQQTHGYIFKYK